MSVKPIPEGYHTITPYLVVADADQLIDYLVAAFNGKASFCSRDKQGRTKHGEVKIGDSMVMIGRADEKSQAKTAMLYLYVEDTDSLYQQALNAGGTSIMEPTNQFYGDRNAGIQDPCGNQWWIATHVEDLSAEEIQKRAQAYHEAN